ncbi:DUF5333 family protein [Paracoccaceae bacterium GXU_MW_L88]
MKRAVFFGLLGVAGLAACSNMTRVGNAFVPDYVAQSLARVVVAQSIGSECPNYDFAPGRADRVMDYEINRRLRGTRNEEDIIKAVQNTSDPALQQKIAQFQQPYIQRYGLDTGSVNAFCGAGYEEIRQNSSIGKMLVPAGTQ